MNTNLQSGIGLFVLLGVVVVVDELAWVQLCVVVVWRRWVAEMMGGLAVLL